MCDICGCGNPGQKFTIRIPGEDNSKQEDYLHEHEHEHYHSHPHSHDHDEIQHHHHIKDDHDNIDPTKKIIYLETDILQANNLMAERNRGLFEAKKIAAINLMSSPGSGKTTILERTINELKGDIDFAVIEGDQQTMLDAGRIKCTGAPVVQVNTGNGCHLDAEMINRAVKKLSPADGSFLMIENVGNLVCPALFDLGEARRVVIVSITEGEDKPVKYPNMFYKADLCLLNKIDLLPYLDFDITEFMKYGHQVNPHLQYIKISAKSGEGMKEWYSWLGTTQTRLT